MNKEVITISSAVFAGALSKGVAGVAVGKSSNTVKLGVSLLLAVGTGYLATKVSGTDGKAAALRGAAVGVAVAQGLEAMKFAFSTPALQQRIASNNFLSKTVGLGDAVNGYIDANGNYREDGMNGYIDINGNYVEDGMNGYYDENGNWIEDGMNGYYDADGNYIEYIADENLGGYYDDEGNFVEGMGAVLADEQGAFSL